MGSLFDTIRLVGARRLLRLGRGRRHMEPLMVGFYATRALQALFIVGALDEMQAVGHLDPAAFAEERGLDVDVLRALCEALFSFRILKKGAKGYSLDRRGRILVGVARAWFLATYGYESVMHDVEALLKKEQTYGDGVNRRIEWVTRGYGEVAQWVFFPWLFALIAKAGVRRVLDLGCGDGEFLRALCETNSTVTGLGLDLAPELIAEGERKVRAAGLEGRIDLQVADMARLAELPGPFAGVDAGTMLLALHEVLYRGTDVVVDMLHGFRTRFPGAALIVIEGVRPSPSERRRRTGMGGIYFLHHDLTKQKPVSREAWRELFEKAGFGSIEEVDLWFAQTIIFTLR